MKRVVLLLLAGLAGFSCTETETPPKIDYIIFGEFYGYCVGGKCIEIFKLQDGRLYEDTTDQYPEHDKFYEGRFIQLADSLYDKAAVVENIIPDRLWRESDTIIGQPDAGDWGGFYLEMRTNNDRRFWLIDKNQDNLPIYLHDFTLKMDSAINLVNDGVF